MVVMARITEKTQKKLYALSGNRCAFPDCENPIIEKSGTVVGETCHIKAKNSGGPRFDVNQSDEERHSYENLILLCRIHHRAVDDNPGIYSDDLLKEMKKFHEEKFGRAERAEDTLYAKMLLKSASNISVVENHGNVAINSPGAMQGRDFHIRTRQKKIAIVPSANAIGASQSHSAYVSHLISTYNKFAGADYSRATKFSYGAISQRLVKNFGTRWQLVALENFEQLCGYLQNCILETRVGSANTAKENPSFSSYENYCIKHAPK
jgi:hypothetical protein